MTTVPPSGSGPGTPSTSGAAQPSHGYKLNWFKTGFRPQFDRGVTDRINRMLTPPNADPLTGFILMACAIDYLAGFWQGRETTGKDYIDFIDTYFPSGRYSASGLYGSLRNGLVHMFTIKNTAYNLTDGNSKLHLKLTKGGQIILNAEDFRDDIIAAKEKFFATVEASPQLLDNVVKRHADFGFIDELILDV